MKHHATASNTKLSSNLKMNGSVRVRVIRTLLAIQQGKSLATVLDPLLNSLHEGDKGFAHALLLTTLRHWHALARLLDSLADKPIDELEVRTTLQVGLAQLLYLEVADHAAIHETVEAAKEIEFARAAGLINAILRKVAKNPNKFRKKCDKNHSLPNWLAYQLKQDWSEQYTVLTQGLRQPAPMFLRVNTAVSSVSAYHQLLTEADISSDKIALSSEIQLSKQHNATTTTQALRLEQTTSVSFLPEFLSGVVSVQDLHAQLAAPLIQLALNHKLKIDNGVDNQLHLLDACAAPGGKLAHWLELLTTDKSSLFHVKQSAADQQAKAEASTIKLTAIDNEAQRITRIHENLQRLDLPLADDQADNKGIALNIVCDDATTWQRSQSKTDSAQSGFDVILLDSPCTATGVIRRHPDISILRTEADVEQTVQLQAQILDNLWPQLKAGGYLLYVTCSILKQENSLQMQDFIKRHNNATAIELTEACNWGIAQQIGRQCLPIDSESGDGFYYALLQKTVE